MAEFFNMGGYAFHVWTTWGVSALLLGALTATRARKLSKLRRSDDDTGET